MATCSRPANTSVDNVTNDCRHNLLEYLDESLARTFLGLSKIILILQILALALSIIMLCDEIIYGINKNRNGRTITYTVSIIFSLCRVIMSGCTGGDLYSFCPFDLVSSFWVLGFVALSSMHLFCVFTFEQLLVMVTNPFSSSKRSYSPLFLTASCCALSAILGTISVIGNHYAHHFAHVWSRLFEISFIGVGLFYLYRIKKLYKFCISVWKSLRNRSDHSAFPVIVSIFRYVRGLMIIATIYVIFIAGWMVRTTFEDAYETLSFYKYRFVAAYFIPCLLEAIASLFLLSLLRPRMFFRLLTSISNGKLNSSTNGTMKRPRSSIRGGGSAATYIKRQSTSNDSRVQPSAPMTSNAISSVQSNPASPKSNLEAN